MKQCSKCNKLVEDDFFNIKKRTKTKVLYHSYCKDCQAIYQKAYYEKAKAKFLAQTKSAKRTLKESVNAKKLNPCTDCKKTYPPYVMDFDHIRDKVENVADMVSNGARLKVEKELEKCELVCANCHRIRTYNRKHGPVV